MNGFEKRTKVKKDAIINAARELFTVRGIKAVSISEIAAKAQVSQVTIYNYFSDKNALCKAVFDFYLDKAVIEYEEILNRSMPFPEKLKLAMNRKHDTEAEAARVYFSEYAWEDKALHKVYYEAATQKSRQLYIKFIELGKKEGHIDVSIPNELILDYLFSVIHIIQAANDQNKDKDYNSAVIKLLLHGILGKED